MKRSILILVSVLLVYTVNAQDVALLEYSNLETSKTNTPEVVTYRSVSAKQSSKVVKALQEEVKNYNVLSSHVYDASEKASYTITFKRKQGVITATYNNNGKLLSTKEFYKNIKLPLTLRQELAKQYPGWELGKNTFNLNFKNGKTQTEYSVVLKKGNKKQTVSL